MLNPLNFISRLIKSNNQKELDRIAKTVTIINPLEENIKNFKNEEFPKKTLEFREKIKTKCEVISVFSDKDIKKIKRILIRNVN